MRHRATIAAAVACALYGSAASGQVNFAVIGDFGVDGPAELNVANLVKGWNPDFIVTTGDNNYPTGQASTIDANIGKYYHDYIGNYTGAYGAGSATNRFFPVLGNHDWGNVANNPSGADPYKGYFTLPGNERYYDLVRGPVHFFMLDSDANEPDGVSSHKTQGQWLRGALAASTAPFKVVVAHHASYSSSSNHGSQSYMQWPMAQWGATAVLNGHDHNYERSTVGGIPYFVNGLGGNPTLYGFGAPIAGSQVRYNGNHGAQRISATGAQMTYEFYSVDGVLRDTYTQAAPDGAPPKVTKSFRQGAGGYAGTQDTYVDATAANVNTSFGNADKIVVDNSPVNQGLIRFDGLFGAGADQIPVGATIAYANLMLVTGTAASDESTTLTKLFRMTADWSESSTYASLTGGITPGSETAASPENAGVEPTLQGVAMNFDVTAALQAWANDPSSNKGWALLADGTDGWRWASSEFATLSERPMLEISYVVPEPGAVGVVALSAFCAIARRRQR